MKKRKVAKLVTGTATQDGAGVKLTRVLSRPDVKDFDPFLMLDAFDSKNPDDYTKGFPWHPHRGIETVTYLVEGDIEHGDSMGNKGSINDGCCQWMTAGSGIIHQEMPKPAPHMLGLQLWINLPKKDKMTAPAYRDIRSEMIPVIKEDGAVIRVIAGEYKGKKGATKGDYVKATYLDVKLESNALWEIDTNPDETVFVYLLQGDAVFEEESSTQYIPAKTAVLMTYGDNMYVKAGDKGARFVLLAAKPLKEDVAWGGPIVMNTREELQNAFEELDNGTFIKNNHPKNIALK
ncbi:hypothetical protein AAIR98_000698 [Elusimicrobium simillimum]|uniref:pirin family protein n=1 Tax=Elusimicrobium simillimum TaxID=3143438 RepID=UPI003C6FA4ED